MNPLSLYAIAAVLFGMAYICHVAEKRSRAWYPDRALLLAQGFFLALGGVVLVWGMLQ